MSDSELSEESYSKIKTLINEELDVIKGTVIKDKGELNDINAQFDDKIKDE
jgi:hypothetical protein